MRIFRQAFILKPVVLISRLCHSHHYDCEVSCIAVSHFVHLKSVAILPQLALRGHEKMD
jgi:hypothetical protein